MGGFGRSAKMKNNLIGAMLVLSVLSSCKEKSLDALDTAKGESKHFTMGKDIVQHIEDIKSSNNVNEVLNPSNITGVWYHDGPVQIVSSPGVSVGLSNDKHTWKMFHGPNDMNEDDAALVCFFYNDSGETAHLYCYKKRALLEANAEY